MKRTEYVEFHYKYIVGSGDGNVVDVLGENMYAANGFGFLSFDLFHKFDQTGKKNNQSLYHIFIEKVLCDL